MTNQFAPYIHLKCWRNRLGKVIGQNLSIFEYQATLNDGWKLMGFDGRKATVCILYDDMTITRIELLEYAIAYMEGRLIEITVDLEQLTVTKRTINPPP